MSATAASAIRNVAIIAHVDHGKTTLVDQLLRTSGLLERVSGERIMDRGDLERERGITILSKCTSVAFEGKRINIIDTPGHADFGGEVERILRMAEGTLLLVDAAEGPRPQTRFVLRKALETGLKPIVVISKIDRKDARPSEVLDEVFDLFCELNASDEQLDFPTVYCSAREGIARIEADGLNHGMELILSTVIEQVPPPTVDPDAPLVFQVTTLDHSDYTGRIAVGRLDAGRLREGATVCVANPDGGRRRADIVQLHVFEGTSKRRVSEVEPGDICEIHGLGEIAIGETVTDPAQPVVLPGIHVDEPTLRMLFCVNDSPMAGREGDHVTSRKLKDRLEREIRSNVALRLTPIDRQDGFLVSGRGVLHLGILIETMRREGYEFCVGKPEVLMKVVDGQELEPIEQVLVEVPEVYQGRVIELVGARRGTVEAMAPRGDGFMRIDVRIPSRGMIGVQSRMMRATAGQAVVHSIHAGYEPDQGELPGRSVGVLVSMIAGDARAYALAALEERGELFIGPGTAVYPGMIVGEHAKDRDITVNPCKQKHLTNIRAAGSDDAIVLAPPRRLSLEECLEYIEDDELVEVTPRSIRLRKVVLDETERRRLEKRKAS